MRRALLRAIRRVPRIGPGIGVAGDLAGDDPPVADRAAIWTAGAACLAFAIGLGDSLRRLHRAGVLTTVNRETLDRMPYREVTDALLEGPGVTVTPGEGNSRDISIRGMSPQYTLILVDGKRLSSRESRTNGGSISEGGLLPPLKDGALSVGDVGAASQDITTIKIMIARIAEQQRTDKSSLDQKLQSIIAHLHAVHGMRGAQGH